MSVLRGAQRFGCVVSALVRGAGVKAAPKSPAAAPGTTFRSLSQSYAKVQNNSAAGFRLQHRAVACLALGSPGVSTIGNLATALSQMCTTEMMPGLLDDEDR
eukprot:CAMPEP_0117647986 /NCGR_PEP_ID=MMETSP0804-20121206/143_1 /TAXON_ID=1074897 /ORGANISM="Tetraselmis astigmatica, Strain CCMP880" /LENGTH=101 /DNA_ID=CAMNT_0005453517 /DNA_START=180 /DNA_END=485 /DNA_ORIENTATION=-